MEPEIMKYNHSGALTHKRIESKQSQCCSETHQSAWKNRETLRKPFIYGINAFIFRCQPSQLSLFWKEKMHSCERIQHPMPNPARCEDPARSIKGRPWRILTSSNPTTIKSIGLWSSTVSSVVSVNVLIQSGSQRYLVYCVAIHLVEILERNSELL